MPAPMPRQNATLRPSSSPRMNASDGSPRASPPTCSRTPVSPGMAYRPLPPMMPISAVATLTLLFRLRRGAPALSTLRYRPIHNFHSCRTKVYRPCALLFAAHRCLHHSRRRHHPHQRQSRVRQPIPGMASLLLRLQPASSSGPSDCTLTTLSRSLRGQLQRKPFADEDPRPIDCQQNIALVGRVRPVRSRPPHPCSAAPAPSTCAAARPRRRAGTTAQSPHSSTSDSYSSPIDAVDSFASAVTADRFCAA